MVPEADSKATQAGFVRTAAVAPTTDRNVSTRKTLMGPAVKKVRAAFRLPPAARRHYVSPGIAVGASALEPDGERLVVVGTDRRGTDRDPEACAKTPCRGSLQSSDG